MEIAESRPAVIESIPLLVERLRASFAAGRTRPLEFRQQQLAALARLLDDC